MQNLGQPFKVSNKLSHHPHGVLHEPVRLLYVYCWTREDLLIGVILDVVLIQSIFRVESAMKIHYVTRRRGFWSLMFLVNLRFELPEVHEARVVGSKRCVDCTHSSTGTIRQRQSKMKLIPINIKL